MGRFRTLMATLGIVLVLGATGAAVVGCGGNGDTGSASARPAASSSSTTTAPDSAKSDDAGKTGGTPTRPSTSSPLDVLVVDDDPGIRQALQRALTLEGFRVRAASDGDKALAELTRHPPDVVVLDVSSPGSAAWRRGVELHLLAGARAADGSWQAKGADRDDTDAISQLVPDVADRDVYLCGPVPWIVAVKRALRRAGVRRAQIHTEKFVW